MAVALTKMLHRGQAVLFREYAPALSKVVKFDEERLPSLREFARLLKERGLAKSVKVEEVGNGLVKLTIEGCALAHLVHPSLGLEEGGELMCPMALIAMVALAAERGYEGGDDVFNFVKFGEGLSKFKPTGSETVFKLL